MTQDRLRRQLESLAGSGVYNVVVINLAPAGPAFGAPPDDPPWFSDEWWNLLRGACEDARRLGVRIWFYDQLGFSAANVQGRVLQANPSYRGRRLERIVCDVEGAARLAVPRGTEPVAAVAVPSGSSTPVPIAIDDGAAEWRGPGAARVTLAYAVPHGYDYLSTEACAALFDYVHGEFDRRAGDLLGDPIVGSFQDELPRLNSWTDTFTETFAHRCGYDIGEHIDALWDRDGPDAAAVRFDYHSTRAALAETAFFEPLHRWHADRGLEVGCDQQSPARAADPVGGAQLYGEYATAARWFHAPGNDHWGDAKFHSSIAHAYRRDRVWLEGFHSTGWGATLEETLDWLLPWLRAGATLFNPHAVYYSTRGGWFEWAPPSNCWRQPYWRHYAEFARAVSRLCSVLSAGVHRCDIGVLYPSTTALSELRIDHPLEPFGSDADRSVYRDLVGSTSWTGGFSGVLERDSRDFDVLDDNSIAGGVVADARLRVADESYRCIILPGARFLTSRTARVLADFAAAGGILLAVGERPQHTAGSTRDDRGAQRVATLARFAADVSDVPAALADLERDVDASVPFLRRRTEGGDLLLVCRPSRTRVDAGAGPLTANYVFDDQRRDPPAVVRVRDTHGTAELWDVFTAERQPLVQRRLDGDIVEVEVPFNRGPAAIVVWSGDGRVPDPERVEMTEMMEMTLPDSGWRCRPDGEASLAIWELDCVGRAARPTVCDRALVAGPTPLDEEPSEWVAHAYSPSHGIPNDPFHVGQFGPKGYVPEEFLRLPAPEVGLAVRVRTLVLADAAENAWLRIGAAAAKEVRWNEQPLASSDGYWLEVPVSVNAGVNLLEMAFSSAKAPLPSPLVGGTTALGVTWSLVRTPDLHTRPEWISAPGSAATTFSARFESTSECGVMHVGSESRLRIRVNDEVIGEQGEHSTYVGMGFRPQFARYELALALGENTIEIESVDGGPLYADVATAERSICTSGASWSITEDAAVRLERIAYRDPRACVALRRPHPLPAAETIEGEATAHAGDVLSVTAAVSLELAPVVLSCKLPPGTRRLTLVTAGATLLDIEGLDSTAFDRGLTLDLPGGAARTCRITVDAPAGHDAGAALCAPPLAVLGDGEIALGDWSALGLAGYSGTLVYAREIELPEADHAVLDLGRVRGTAEVRLNGSHVGTRICSPWKFDLTPRVATGTNLLEIVVCNTLGPRLGAETPTRLASNAQRSSGLLGPITIQVRGASHVS